jgi:predicted GNAT family N-acyltransferase
MISHKTRVKVKGLGTFDFNSESVSYVWYNITMEDFKIRTNQLEDKEKSIDIFLESLEKIGATITADKFESDAYIVQFNFEQGEIKTTLRILFHDKTGSDVVIANMTTLPDEAKGKGFGGDAIQNVLQWARDNSFNEVRATQVQTESEGFWTKNGFIKDEEYNLTNDYVYHFDNK